MAGAQGGMILILAAICLAVLWYRGYLATWTAAVVNLLGGDIGAKENVGGFLSNAMAQLGANAPAPATMRPT
jgi:hypothetical protein